MNSGINLRGKKLLVTAGSTWVPIDDVRVITNIFRGSIGFTVAELAAAAGADVTLLLGPSFNITSTKLPDNLHIIRFKYFDELDLLITQKLNTNKFNAVIHSAAVSDFKLANKHVGKVKSETSKLVLELIPTKKIVDYIKNISPNTYLIKFKLEVGVTPEQLKDIALTSMKKSNADLIVASIYDPQFSDHEAYLFNTKGITDKISGKKLIAEEVLKEINDNT